MRLQLGRKISQLEAVHTAERLSRRAVQIRAPKRILSSTLSVHPYKQSPPRVIAHPQWVAMKGYAVRFTAYLIVPVHNKLMSCSRWKIGFQN